MHTIKEPDGSRKSTISHSLVREKNRFHVGAKVVQSERKTKFLFVFSEEQPTFA